MDKYSLYLHVPFCRHRCSYCDFNTFAGQDRWIPAYVDALCSEIRQVSARVQEKLPAHTIFFGGGTPSLLSTTQLDKILSTLQDCFLLQDDSEVTLEANPGTVTLEYLTLIRRLGINRLSFGMQSAHPDDLRLLERQHDFFDVVQAVNWARLAGFENLSLDLIFGLPSQSLDRWKETLKHALGMSPQHLSLYALTIEHGTPLYKRWGRGLVPLVDDDLAADMYEYAMDRLEKAGYVQYEISNWARIRPQGGIYSCVHNLQYWRGLPYLGFGAGGHGFAGGLRTMNVGGIRPYIDRCNAPFTGSFPMGPATRKATRIETEVEMQETMMVGLRLTQEGVSEVDFFNRFGKPVESVFGMEIHKLLRAGLLEWIGENEKKLRLTYRGRLLGNQVFMQFVG